uniref:Large ribosomal subunit protein bL28c n=1 Tax=Pyropia perforata TaxID=182771 RepID=A0A023HQS7_PYRPE|nr:50S ribosomal protein L28 [Neoporphyra perforata]AGQ17056.1 50S ribosomal protein L28 [Neoporphyra perforata]AHB35211.1 50S ribosomal protein L28 [Neoporphyra perforata]AIA19373.1 50S ribosomal protein L28 [Neoporphyra perforata]AIA19791.1 50S ribosomal protein L28 [Neoporphyra perforata]AIA20000.1 50S ribosomal protein L28 [Neoporphyra perforata]
MSKKCCLTGKVANNGYAVSHSHKRTKKLQKVNLQYKKVWSREQNKWIKMLISTKAIKTLTRTL